MGGYSNNGGISGIPANPILIGLKIASPAPITNGISSFVAILGASSITVTIAAGQALSATSIVLYRNYSQDTSTGTQLVAWAGPLAQGQTLTFVDTDPNALAAARCYYYALLVYGSGPDQTTLTAGPIFLNVNQVASTTTTVPEFALSITAGTGGTLTLGVSFQNPNDPNIAYALLRALNYLGDASEQAIATSIADPFNVVLQATGVAVTFRLYAVTAQGQIQYQNDYPAGSQVVLTLSNTTTVPATIYNATAITLKQGVQISFPAGPEANITTYKIFRNATGVTFTGATMIGSFTSTGNTSYAFVDTSGVQSDAYFVVAVNAVGQSAPSPVIVPSLSYYSPATAGTGAAGTPTMVTPYGLTTLTVGGVNMTNTGNGSYYATPTVTFSSPAGAGRVAQGYPQLDGAGHVAGILVTDGGVYATSDTVTVSIHY